MWTLPSLCTCEKEVYLQLVGMYFMVCSQNRTNAFLRESAVTFEQLGILQKIVVCLGIKMKKGKNASNGFLLFYLHVLFFRYIDAFWSFVQVHYGLFDENFPYFFYYRWC